MLRQDRELPHDLRQFAIAGGIERECDLALARRFGFDDMAIISGELRIVGLERREGENHVIGRDRLPVVPFRFRMQTIRDGREIGRMRQRFGKQPVFRRWLVQRGRQQRVVNELYPRRELTLPSGQDHVEVVVCAEGGLAEGAAFWRTRIHVIEVGKAGGILEIAKER